MHRSASVEVVTSFNRSDCYRLERQLPGGVRTRWVTAPFHGARIKRARPLAPPPVQRRNPRGPDDEGRLVADIIELAHRYGRYGYRRIAALLHDAGWQVNDKQVERLWRREGLKVPGKQPKRGRLWLNDGSCVRLRAERAGRCLVL